MSWTEFLIGWGIILTPCAFWFWLFMHELEREAWKRKCTTDDWHCCVCAKHIVNCKGHPTEELIKAARGEQ